VTGLSSVVPLAASSSAVAPQALVANIDTTATTPRNAFVEVFIAVSLSFRERLAR
jgi:hypothetical protein